MASHPITYKSQDFVFQAFSSLFHEIKFQLPTAAVDYAAIKDTLYNDFQLTLGPQLMELLLLIGLLVPLIPAEGT